MIFIFWLITLIFFKVITKIAFDHEITVLAAAIISTIYAALMLWAQLAAARAMDASPLRMAADGRLFAGALAVPYAICGMAAIGIALAVVYGFSDRLSRDLFNGYGHEWELLWFIGIACIPIACHVLVSAAQMRMLLMQRWR